MNENDTAARAHADQPRSELIAETRAQADELRRQLVASTSEAAAAIVDRARSLAEREIEDAKRRAESIARDVKAIERAEDALESRAQAFAKAASELRAELQKLADVVARGERWLRPEALDNGDGSSEDPTAVDAEDRGAEANDLEEAIPEDAEEAWTDRQELFDEGDEWEEGELAEFPQAEESVDEATDVGAQRYLHDLEEAYAREQARSDARERTGRRTEGRADDRVAARRRRFRRPFG